MREIVNHNVAIPAVFNSIKRGKIKKNGIGEESNSPMRSTLLNYNSAYAGYFKLSEGALNVRFKIKKTAYFVFPVKITMLSKTLMTTMRAQNL